MNEDYIPGTLGKRQIYWCPSGEGNNFLKILPFCSVLVDYTAA